jgi:hypothetical protein
MMFYIFIVFELRQSYFFLNTVYFMNNQVGHYPGISHPS